MMTEDYEQFSEEQIKILKKYVTNTSGRVFVLRNLPEVIKGALFSRYSRSSLGLRSLLLKEFIQNSDETAFDQITVAEDSIEAKQQTEAIKKAQNFYDRILDGYGDDSIGELGGAHLAIENISMLAAKEIEDCRIGGSPLEKSTRYIYFDQKVNGEYLFYREPILMISAYGDLYVETCNMLFDTYSKLIPKLTEIFEHKFPRDPETSKTAYSSALRAKVLDCLRGLLPAGALTNMGMYGNGRFFEHLIHKLHCQNLAELQELGKLTFEELNKEIPSFVRRADLSHRTHQSYSQFFESMESEKLLVTQKYTDFSERNMESGVHLIDWDEDAVLKVAAAMIYENSNKGMKDLWEHCKNLSEEEIASILDAGANARETRRQKSPRALENAYFTFEFLSDFGAYRDLHRHRMLTQERQTLTCDYGFYTPEEIEDTELEEPYHEALLKAKEAYDVISKEFPEEAQYIVPMAYRVRWYFKANLRAIQWLTELRSGAAGHPTYRYAAQAMAKQVCEKFPLFERFFKFVDYEGFYEFGRMNQEKRRAEKSGL